MITGFEPLFRTASQKGGGIKLSCLFPFWQYLPGECLHHDFPIANHKRIRAKRYLILGGVECPNDVSRFSFNHLLQHFKFIGARWGNLGGKFLKERPDFIKTMQRTVRRHDDRFWRIILQDFIDITGAKGLQVMS